MSQVFLDLLEGRLDIDELLPFVLAHLVEEHLIVGVVQDNNIEVGRLEGFQEGRVKRQVVLGADNEVNLLLIFLHLADVFVTADHLVSACRLSVEAGQSEEGVLVVVVGEHAIF